MLAYAHSVPIRPSLLKGLGPLHVAIERLSVPSWMLSDDAEETLRLQALARLSEAGIDVVDDGPRIIALGDLSTSLGRDAMLVISLSAVFDCFMNARVIATTPVERSGSVAVYVSHDVSYVMDHESALRLLGAFIAAWREVNVSRQHVPTLSTKIKVCNA